ncbi:hypothetical protein E2320_008588 [Naja naja]|nr:hypothetical protein E2320_008588 [Naja naja]
MFGKQDKMDVRCNSELETNRLSKNGHKEGKESKAPKEIFRIFEGTARDFFGFGRLGRLRSADPDYCRRILVRDAKGSIREIILPKGLDLDRPKRTRTSFTAEQLYRLEMEFQRCQYVVGRERTELARQLNLSETQVLKIQMSKSGSRTDAQSRKRPRQRLRDEVASCDSSNKDACSPRPVCLACFPLRHQRLGLGLASPSLASRTGGSGSGTTGSSTHHPTVSSAAAGPAHPSPPGGHNLFSLPVPTLLGSVASRLSSNPLAMAGSLAGNLQELSARYLSSSAFEPYSRTASKESAEKGARLTLGDFRCIYIYPLCLC